MPALNSAVAVAGLVIWLAAMILLPRVRSKPLRENLEAWLYLAPAAVVLLAFWFLPVVFSVFVSFSDWTGAAQLADVAWTGLANYRRAFQDEQFVQVLYNTINYVAYSVPLTMIAALGVAVLLNAQVMARGIFRTIYFLPYVTTWVAISIVFKYIFNEQFGLINYVLEALGISGYAWLNEPRGIIQMMLEGTGMQFSQPLHPFLAGPSLAMFSVILTSVWRDLGYFMVIFLAGLQNIDRSYYEAADLDGAGPWQKFRHVTWPLLSPTTFFILIVSMIAAFKVFVPMFIMTPNGTPGGTTETLVSYLFKIGFTGYRELGYASAVAYILFIIILLLTMLQNRFFGSKVHYS
jgi:multiple sugar transport system permease protein